jgi:hypothetical protein
MYDPDFYVEKLKEVIQQQKNIITENDLFLISILDWKQNANKEIKNSVLDAEDKINKLEILLEVLEENILNKISK